MEFIFDIAFNTGLLALIAGLFFYLWTSPKGPTSAGFSRVLGFFVIIFAILSIFCSIYWGLRYRASGYFATPSGMHPIKDTV